MTVNNPIERNVSEQAAEWIRNRAKSFGFTHVRFCSAEGAPGIDRYDRFLDNGRHGEMNWMKRSRAPRANPALLLPDAQSAVVLGIDYAWPRPEDPGGLTGKVSCYAWGRDYHNLMGKRLRRLGNQVKEELNANVYWGVDSRPLIERAWAAKAGLGYIGKNCCVILPAETSFIFLAVMLVSIELPPNTPTLRDHCGQCRRCLDACPTDAFVGPNELDARRCISYLTIEHEGSFPKPIRKQMGRWVFGCDLCQDVCPHNVRLSLSKEDDFQPRGENAWLDLEWILTADDDALMAHFVGSPIRRSGPIGLKRNAAVVCGNMGDRSARTALLHGINHSSPIVTEHCQWALDMIG